MVNRGKFFENEIAQSLKVFGSTHPNFLWRRLSDTLSYMRINKNIIMPKVLCDFIALYNGIFYALECKSSRGPTSYRREYIQNHQVQSLIDVSKAGGRGIFLINNRSVSGKFKCYVVNGYEIENLFNGRKSVKWSILSEHWQDLKRLKAGLWGVEALFL